MPRTEAWGHIVCGRQQGGCLKEIGGECSLGERRNKVMVCLEEGVKQRRSDCQSCCCNKADKQRLSHQGDLNRK